MRGITRDTVVELVDRKVLWLFAGLTVVALVMVYFTSDISINMNGYNGDLGQAVPSDLVAAAVVRGFDAFMSFLVFLAVMASAGLIPRMLERGRVDFYLAKPLSRSGLLLNKLGAVWLVYTFVVMLCAAVVYVVTVLAHGGFDFRILYLFAAYAVLMVIWLSITGLAGVVFGSTPLAMISAFLVWVLQTILSGHETINQFLDSRVARYVIDILYYVLPKPSEISDMSMQLVLGRPVDSWMPLWSSVVFAAVMIYLAVWFFKRKSF